MRNLEDQSGEGMTNEEIVATWKASGVTLAPYQMGFIAFVEGKPIDADPYADSVYVDREWWQSGYSTAMKRKV